MGNGEAKELICMTHGHKLRRREVLKGRGHHLEGSKGGKYWDNYNSIINKIYLKINILRF